MANARLDIRLDEEIKARAEKASTFLACEKANKPNPALIEAAKLISSPL